MSPASCTQAAHEELKAAPLREFLDGTQKLDGHNDEAYQPCSNGSVLHLRNCKRCNSTISRLAIKASRR